MTTVRRVDVDALTVTRGARTLLRGLSFGASFGEAVAITGPNGAGKTSLLRSIAGFIHPLSGTIGFVGAGGEIDVEAARRDHCHLIGHADGFCAGRTSREELTFAVRWTGGTVASAAEGAMRMGLGRVLDLPVRHLSAGQRRRLALTRLIAARRSVWLLDEPLTPLDADGRTLMGQIMSDHLSDGGIIIAAVHDPLPIAARVVEVAE